MSRLPSFGRTTAKAALARKDCRTMSKKTPLLIAISTFGLALSGCSFSYGTFSEDERPSPQPTASSAADKQ